MSIFGAGARKFSSCRKNSCFYFESSAVVLLTVIFFLAILAHPGCRTIKLTELNMDRSNVQRIFATPPAREKESPDLCLIQKNSLAAVSPPIIITPQVLGAIIDGSDFREEEPRKEIFEYIVEPEDNLSSIAAKFDITLNTILWANKLSENSIIKPGQKLVILPVSGVIHYVEKGDAVSQLAETYKVDVEKIIAFNELSGDGNIVVGDILIIPGGKMPSRNVYAPSSPAPLASSYFICPIPSPCRISQGLHWYNAVDFSHEGASCGLPVFAAAEGTVQKTGYTSLGGNFVRILHPNGVVTYYGHLQAILVKPGQQVYQGAIIGYIGYSGYTVPRGPAGCHLHFDVRGARNPFAL